MLDIFEPKCGQDEVILINKALYGRMAVGKCIKENYGPMKCYADVQKQLDSVCSGRKSCSVRPLDQMLAITNPCQTTSFSSYLTVSYSCLKGKLTLHTINAQCVFQ